jgi:hypothetical protein
VEEVKLSKIRMTGPLPESGQHRMTAPVHSKEGRRKGQERCLLASIDGKAWVGSRPQVPMSVSVQAYLFNGLRFRSNPPTRLSTCASRLM